MNTSHYPSLELCKKLTEIGFPETEIFWWESKDGKCYDSCFPFVAKYVRPTIMEMLDVMPEEIGKDVFHIYRMKTHFGVLYQNSWGKLHDTHGTLPNAIAEMILWLHENNYITFSKG